MQLVAYGAQDIYLSGNPQITFWKVVYRRHTNFARETIEQTISGSSTLTSGNRGTVTVSRNGDLLSKVYVTTTGAVAGLGDAAISDVEVQIGGQKIDKHTAEWMQLWAELTTPDSKADAYKAMIGVSGTQGSGTGTGVYMTQIPLQFWFCRNPGLALPLIALQYHEVKLVFNWGTAGGATAKVLCDYVYLDTDERRRFAQVSHEYLIEQLQYQAEGSSKSSYKLTLNHPVKALYWTDADVLTTHTMKLKLNGHDRFAAQEKEYFRLRQPMDHHTAVPAQNLPSAAYAASRGATTAYTNITGNSGNSSLLADIDQAIAGAAACTATEFNTVLIGGSGTTFTDNSAITAAGANETRFVAVNGSATGSLVDGSLAVGDIHIVVLADTGAVAASKSTLATVRAFYKNAAGTIPTDGTGPLKSGETVTQHTDSGTDTTGDQLIIEYDQAINNASALADGDTLTIIKVANAGCRTSSMTRNINMYSFALEPEEHQPSGTCNFSRIDTATLELSPAATIQNIYAVNYNVLRIMSGMGGLAYSN